MFKSSARHSGQTPAAPKGNTAEGSEPGLGCACLGWRRRSAGLSRSFFVKRYPRETEGAARPGLPATRRVCLRCAQRLPRGCFSKGKQPRFFAWRAAVKQKEEKHNEKDRKPCAGAAAVCRPSRRSGRFGRGQRAGRQHPYRGHGVCLRPLQLDPAGFFQRRGAHQGQRRLCQRLRCDDGQKNRRGAGHGAGDRAAGLGFPGARRAERHRGLCNCGPVHHQ